MIKASGVLFSSCLHPFDELWLQENPIFNGLVDTEELKSLFWFKTKYGKLFSPDPASNVEGFMAYLMIMPKISCIFTWFRSKPGDNRTAAGSWSCFPGAAETQRLLWT